MTLCFSNRRALWHQLTDSWTQNGCGNTNKGLWHCVSVTDGPCYINELTPWHKRGAETPIKVMTLCFSNRRALLHQLTDSWTQNGCGNTNKGLWHCVSVTDGPCYINELTPWHEMGAETSIKVYDSMFQWPTGIVTSTNRLLEIKWVRKCR